MSLFDELSNDVSELLGDPDLKHGTIVLRRKTLTYPTNEWEGPTESYELYTLDAVSFTKRARFSGGTLVTEQRDRLTVSVYAMSDAGSKERIQILDSDEILVDDRARSVLSCVAVPANGDPTMYTIEVTT